MIILRALIEKLSISVVYKNENEYLKYSVLDKLVQLLDIGEDKRKITFILFNVLDIIRNQFSNYLFSLIR